MRSTGLQLLVTLAATLVAAGVFFHRGPPPSRDFGEAVRLGDCSNVVRGVRWGHDVDSLGTIGYTPLHEAIRAGHLDVARELIALGADVNVRTGGNVVLLQIPTPFPPGGAMSPWIPRCQVGYMDYADNHAGGSETPLHWAILMHNADAVRLLLEHGADAGIPYGSMTEKSTIDLAAGQRHQDEILRLLRTHGAK